MVPKLQPIVSEYIQSEFINSIGLGVQFLFLLFYNDFNWENFE